MFKLIRTEANNKDFLALVKCLDSDLAERDGKDHSFYSQFNKITHLKFAVIAYVNDIAIGCGAIKEFDLTAMEVKRMYVISESRGKGIATKILTELESWAKELSYNNCLLATGKRQPEAIKLYRKNGYKIIPNFGQYAGIENSLCFEKELK